MTKRKQWRMSATALSAFKACPTRFRLAYVEGLRKIEETEAQRMGTNWHKCLEVARAVPGTKCPVCFARTLDTLARNDCPVCAGQGLVPESESLDRAIAYLDECYAVVPDWADRTSWAVERVILAYSLSGYLWYYAEMDAEIETIATEVEFELPLRNPKTHRALPNVVKVGKIDRLIRYQGNQVLVNEYKSTTKSIDQDSTYWNRLNLDTQIGLYVLAAVELWALGTEWLDLTCPAGVLYDVWHRPGIKPKKLTQGDTKKFLTDGQYMGQEFEVKIGPDDPERPEDGPRITVNGEDAEITPGAEPKSTKKNPIPERPFAIRETPEMFGARLLADIQETPEKYFVRKPIARTSNDLDKVAHDLYNIYQTIRLMNKSGHWFGVESQCEATFHCAYCPICYHNLDVFDGVTPVDGFKRIYKQETADAEAASTQGTSLPPSPKGPTKTVTAKDSTAQEPVQAGT